MSLNSICHGNFAVTTCDICIFVDGIGWVQILPLEPVNALFQAIWSQKAIDVSAFRLAKLTIPSLTCASFLQLGCLETDSTFATSLITELTVSWHLLSRERCCQMVLLKRCRPETCLMWPWALITARVKISNSSPHALPTFWVVRSH